MDGMQTEEINDVNEANLQVRELLLENGNGGERLHGGDIAGASQHHIGILAIVGGSPIPNANALGAMGYGLVHAEILQMGLFVRDDYIDVIAGAQAVVGDAEETICVRRQVNADYTGAFVGDHVEEAGILMRETVVILTPDQRSDEDVDGGHGGAPVRIPFSISPTTWRVG